MFVLRINFPHRFVLSSSREHVSVFVLFARHCLDFQDSENLLVPADALLSENGELMRNEENPVTA